MNEQHDTPQETPRAMPQTDATRIAHQASPPVLVQETKAKTYTDFVLPPAIVTRPDVSRLVSEVESVDNELTASAVRTKAGVQEAPVPVLSGELTDFLNDNQLKLENGQERAELVKQLRILKDKVPIIHMTFAVRADRESLQKLAQWLRTSVHPQAVISVGLQPALVAGVYLRTPNHVHDLSLRAMLAGSHDILIKELEAVRGSK
jgi:hypothetical protein